MKFLISKTDIADLLRWLVSGLILNSKWPLFFATSFTTVTNSTFTPSFAFYSILAVLGWASIFLIINYWFFANVRFCGSYSILYGLPKLLLVKNIFFKAAYFFYFQGAIKVEEHQSWKDHLVYCLVFCFISEDWSLAFDHLLKHLHLIEVIHNL